MNIKITKNSLLVVAVSVALVFSALAMIVAGIACRRPAPTEKNVVPTAVAPVQQQARPVVALVKDVCWNPDNCFWGPGSFRMGWEWLEEWSKKTYTFRLGETDKDGEIRFLWVRDDKGRLARVGQLPPELTYMQDWSEGEGSAFNHSPVELAIEGNSSFRIAAYSTASIELYDYRLPVVIKSVAAPFDYDEEAWSEKAK